MARGYLNSFSFPADSLTKPIELLDLLRFGIAALVKDNAINWPVMCSIRASKLPLSPDYKVLSDGLSIDKGRFHDTILFFLRTLDQQAPAQAALDAELRAEMEPHIVDHLESAFDPDASSVLVACALDHGVLLSIGSHERWRSERVSFETMTATSKDVRVAEVDNVWDVGSATSLCARIAEARSKLRFENWVTLTGNAAKASQLDEWFEECQNRPGLEQLIMRSLTMAYAAGYRIDGDLIKKLGGDSAISVLEIRAFYNGSNNVRLLFSRGAGGRAIYGYGGIKTHKDWYETAIPQALRNIQVLMSQLGS